MNDQNLIPNEMRTPSERRENARKAGIASGKARKEKADLRKLMKMMVDERMAEQDITHAQRLTMSLLEIAENPKQGGSAVRAYETIMRVLGQDTAEVETDALRQAREILGGVDSVID